MQFLESIIEITIVILSGLWAYLVHEIKDIKRKTEGLSEKYVLKDDMKELKEDMHQRLDRIEDRQEKIHDLLTDLLKK
jgi:hypothetical protein